MTQSTDTRRQILETAATLFHTRSYSDVGVAAICKQAGVSKGSFFHFFPTKQDLALAVMEQFRDQINRTLLARAFSTRYPPLERLQRFVNELYEFQKAKTEEYGHLPGCPFGNFVVEQATQDELLRSKADGCLRSIANHIRTAVADAVQSGDLPPLDEDATADAMLGYIEGIQLMAKAHNDPDVIRRLGPAVTAIRIGGKA
jgi:TetR/AcrR family transcriptional repressor of nem operon